VNPKAIMAWVPVVRALASIVADLWRAAPERRAETAEELAAHAKALGEQSGMAARRSSEATVRRMRDPPKHLTVPG